MPEAEPASPKPASPNRSGPLGYAALAVAAVFAIAVGAYVFTAGDDDRGDAFPTLSPQIGTPEPDTGPLDPNRPEEGEPAPDFALRDARDPSKLVKLSDFRGRPVVLNFYYEDCPPCELEIPLFVRTSAEHPELAFLGVDYLEGPEDALRILEKHGATYPAVLDRSGSVADHYRVRGFPTTVFIDADGIVRAIRSGEVKEAALADYLQKVGID